MTERIETKAKPQVKETCWVGKEPGSNLFCRMIEIPKGVYSQLVIVTNSQGIFNGISNICDVSNYDRRETYDSVIILNPDPIFSDFAQKITELLNQNSQLSLTSPSK